MPLPGCNKFVDPESPLVPEQLVLWSKALAKLDQDPHLRPDGAQNAGYMFPDPALFISVATKEKMITYLKNWLQYHPTFIYCVSSTASSPHSLSSQTWRTFLLSANYADVEDSLSTFQSWQAEIMAIIGGLNMEGVSVKLDPPSVITFCNVPVKFTMLLQIYDVQPILWELYELNF